MDVLVAGCGWLGREVARRLTARGHRVTGLTKSESSAAALRAAGIEAVAVDLSAPSASSWTPRRYDGVVVMLSAGARSVDAYRRVYLDGTSGLLSLACVADASLVYVSSTGVFGQADGGWVAESTVPRPADAIANVLVAAERVVLERPRRARTCIVRCSGLYGPERTGTIERVRTGALALGPADSIWMNFCHRDDAADTVIAALSRGRPGATYHASDAVPTTRHHVVSWIAQRLKIEPTWRADESHPRRHAANRRVSAEATRRELSLSLVYPSFREGFAPFLP